MGNATIEDNQLERPEIMPVADHDRSRIAVAWFAFANSISVSTSAGVKNSGLQSSLLAAGAAWCGNCPASRRHYPRRGHANNSRGGTTFPENHLNRIGTTSAQKILNQGSRSRFASPGRNSQGSKKIDE